MPNVKPKQFGRWLSVRVPESVYRVIDDVARHQGLGKERADPQNPNRDSQD